MERPPRRALVNTLSLLQLILSICCYGNISMSTYQSKAFVYQGRPKAVTTETIAVECGPRDLVLQIIMCARCGTDKTIYQKGHTSVDPYAPVVLGHELVGRIVEVGSEVKSLKTGIGYREGTTLSDAYLNFKVGERVAVQSRIARHRNGLMLIPNPIANLSFQINGGYAQYMKVPETMIVTESVLRVPDNITDEEACLVEPAACALESIFATPHEVCVDAEGRHLFHTGIQPGGNVCIIGSGTVSMIYGLLARAEGAQRVIMIVRSEAKAEQVTRVAKGLIEPYVARGTGDAATAENLAAEARVVRDLAEMTNGYLFDDVVAACAASGAQRLMLKLYTKEGYAVGACFGGTHQLVDSADIDTNHYRAAKTIGTSGCSTDCMKTIMKWLENDRLDLNGFISRQKFTLEDDPNVFLTTAADGLKPALWLA
jgi:L-iditol 2-dehydrogenase